MIVDGANGQNAKPWDYHLDNKGLDLLANAGWPMVLEFSLPQPWFRFSKNRSASSWVSKNPMMS